MSAHQAPLPGGNLPAELTSFVGRRRELAEVKRLLALSRLVSLTGVGGAGKTRLALRAADNASRDFPDGVWFVDLAALDDPDLLAQSIASTLGLHDRRARWPVAELAKYLVDKKLLLVLDNCDHLRDECAVLADALLRQARDLRILATSRQTLGVTGEHVFRVPPLTLPEPETDLPLAAVSQYEAVNLFVERARAVRPEFELTDHTVRAATAICQRLDGIPLAIELAAARLSALSVQELLERLEDRFQVLVGGSPSARPRHRTLRELIGWSWDLCTDAERTLWRRASVFPTGFDLSAAEAVCAGPPLDPEAILHVVTTLVEKSIVTAHEDAGRVRYRMLETLRQYGLEQLDASAEQQAVREKHRAYYTELGHAAAADWFSERQTEWLGRLRLELSNVRVALDTSYQSPELVDSGLDLVSALWFFWIATGHTNEARRWLERGLKADSPSTTARTRAMVSCAYVCIQQEDLTTSWPLIYRAHEAATAEESPANLAWATQLRAMAAMAEGDLTGAEPLFEQALRAHRANEDLVGAIDTIFFLAAVYALRGAPTRAEALYREAITTCENHGERWYKCYMLWGLGLVAWQQDDVDRATAHAREALRIGQLLNELWAIAFCVEFLAWTAQTAGDHDRAANLLGGAEELWRRVGWRRAGVPLYYGLRDLTTYHDQCLSRLGEQLGADELQLAMRNGAAMTLDDLVVEALGEKRERPAQRTPDRQGLPSLTKREKEVAGLVAQGLSNKEIADRLVISPRTAEAHLEHVLNKLGFNSRVQVAAWVVERRGTAPKSET